MDQVLNSVRRALAENSNEEVRESARRFFREAITLYGVKTPVVQKIAKEHFKTVKSLPKAVIFDLCEQLWRSGYQEEAIVACNWSYDVRNQYEPADFLVFERWIKLYVTNWASCDTLCNHTIGAFLETFPDYISQLKEWTGDENRWMKRAAAVSLIIPARKGLFRKEIFEIAGALLNDKDDMVQKGYGWMLKAASEADQDAVFEYVLKNKLTMPRTALRYAIEKMPAEMKSEAMAKG